MKRRNFLSILLVLCMLFQPFVPLFAENSNTAEVSSAETQFLDAYDQISKLEEIDVSECEGIIKAATGIENTGHAIKNGFTWLGNQWDKLTNDGKNQKEYDEYADYIGQIKEANKKIIEAKAQAECMKTAFDNGGIDAAKNADPSKVSKGSLETQMQAMDDARTALTDAGNCLKDVAKTMETIATVLSGLSTVAGLLSLIPALSGPCAVISLALGIAGDVLSPVAKCMDSAGDGLIAAAQAGANSEAGTYAMDNFKHTAVEEAPKAAFNIALDVVGSKYVGGESSNAIKDASSKYLDDVLDLGGNASKLWDPTSSIVGDTFKYVGTNLGWSEKAIKVASDVTVKAPRAANSFYKAATGENLYENPLTDISVKSQEKNIVKGVGGWLADQVAPAYHEPDLNYDGDDDE